MQNQQHSSSPFSTGTDFSFLCLCFLTILWNEVFFWDGDGPDIAKETKEKKKKMEMQYYGIHAISCSL